LPTAYINQLTFFPEGSLPNSRYDVVLATNIFVQQFEPRYVWSSSLLYCKPPGGDDYRWHEASFMRTFGSGDEMQPMSLLGIVKGARSRYEHLDLALSNIVHIYQPAFGPIPIDDEKEEYFIARWITIFAAAAEGKLKHPIRLPLDPSFWTKMAIYGV
jgi:hypothetical protein